MHHTNKYERDAVLTLSRVEWWLCEPGLDSGASKFRAWRLKWQNWKIGCSDMIFIMYPEGIWVKYGTNLKDDGGLLSYFPWTVFFPKSCLCSPVGVNGRWVDWIWRDCLASLIISALVLTNGWRLWVIRPHNSCFLSRVAILTYEALAMESVISC